jgi:sugar phosphate isomerase/epimerase
MNRREFLAGTAASGVLSALCGATEAAEPQAAAGRWKFTMYQGSLRQSGPEVMDLAKRVGLDGVEVLMGQPKDNLPMRRPELRREFKEASRRSGVAISSVCISALNQVPLKSEPKTAIWLLDTIEACADFGCKNILVPFFGKGELKMEVTEEVDRAVDALKELAPRAARTGVILGLENTLSADDNLKILERVSSPAVLVYYDIGNSFTRGRDIPAEIRKLGAQRICQFHIKDNPSLLGQGKMDIPAVAAAIRDIDFRGWLGLETNSPSGDVEKDTKANLTYLKQVLGV